MILFIKSEEMICGYQLFPVFIYRKKCNCHVYFTVYICLICVFSVQYIEMHWNVNIFCVPNLETG